nr:hypothetical protein [uncultured Flavobacterium sp.]
MKTMSFGSLLCIMLLASSCQNNPDIENLETGTWHITDFKEKGILYKNEFRAYLFRFDAHNAIHAFYNHHTYNGKWSIKSDYITDDEPFADSYLSISMKEKPFKNINGNYVITYFSENKLTLESENFLQRPPVFITLKKVE